MAILKTKLGPLKFKQKNIYHGIKRIDKIISKKNLLDIKKILDKEELYFGLMFGTLLGAIREHDFITYDEDIDLFILSEDEDKFKKLLFILIAAGFELIRYDRSGLYSISRDGEYIDFYVMKPYSNGVRWNGADNFILEKFLIDTKYIDFMGSNFLVPSESETFLEFFYGNNWRTPIEYSNFKVSKSKIIILKLFLIIKRLLPDKIYYKYISVYYLSRYKKLLKKCKEKNIEL